MKSPFTTSGQNIVRLAGLAALAVVAVGVSGDAGEGVISKIKRVLPVTVGQHSTDREVHLERGVAGASELDSVPLYVDIESTAVRSRIERQAAGEHVAARPPEPAPASTPTKPAVRRIEFDVPEVRIVNPSDEFVFMPNAQKMSGPRGEQR